MGGQSAEFDCSGMRCIRAAAEEQMSLPGMLHHKRALHKHHKHTPSGRLAFACMFACLYVSNDVGIVEKQPNPHMNLGSGRMSAWRCARRCAWPCAWRSATAMPRTV